MDTKSAQKTLVDFVETRLVDDEEVSTPPPPLHTVILCAEILANWQDALPDASEDADVRAESHPSDSGNRPPTPDPN